MIRPKVSLIICLMFTVLPAVAAVTYTDETDFLNASGSLSMESFESFDASFALPGFESIEPVDFVVSNEGAGGGLNIWSNSVDLSINSTDGFKYLRWYANDPSIPLTYTFPSPIQAFGVNIIDFGTPEYSSPLTFTTDTGINGNAAIELEEPGNVQGNVQFFGIMCPGMTSITFMRPIQNDSIGFDEVYYGVPEPATMVLMGLGGLVMRKRRS